MKENMKRIMTLTCAVIAAASFSAGAHAEMFKCTKDGKTTFQEQPCGEQGGAETKMQSSKPSAWVGCYQSTGSGFDSGIKRIDDWEVPFFSRGMTFVPGSWSKCKLPWGCGTRWRSPSIVCEVPRWLPLVNSWRIY